MTVPGDGDYCPWPLMSDGYPHEVVNGMCMNCGGTIWPRSFPNRLGLWRTGHYRLVPRK